MKRLSTGFCRLAILFLIAFLISSLISPPGRVQAQTTAGATRTAGAFSYDASKEVTLTGRVSSVLAKAAPGMIPGSHLLVETSSGTVDASLGRFGLRGNGAVAVVAGQQIEVTGVMKMVKDKPLFLARTVKVGDEVYTVRNEHGLPLSPQARARAGQTGQKGKSL